MLTLFEDTFTPPKLYIIIYSRVKYEAAVFM